VGSLEGAHAAVAAAKEVGGHTPVHIKVDTGMHRMGVVLDDLDAVLDVLYASPNIVIEGMYSHFAVADSDLVEDREYCEVQMTRFERALEIAAAKGITPPLTHLANSAAAIALPASRRSMVRVGLSAYGYLPHPSMEALLAAQGFRLRPALSLHARVTAVRNLEAGERPSYGRRRPLPTASTVATVPFGYADGYPRRFFDAGAEVLINGIRRPLAGSVTMDQLVVDCVGGDVRVGDEVILLGTQGDETISADEWAAWGGTITWEVLCGIGARVPRITRH
jgi:alanine racemase